jgi:hypothetical protein
MIASLKGLDTNTNNSVPTKSEVSQKFNCLLVGINFVLWRKCGHDVKLVNFEDGGGCSCELA